MQSLTSWQFGRVGALVGTRPYLFLLFSILVLVPGFYGLFFKLNVHLGVDEGFTRLDAPSRREISYQKQFFGANDSAVPWYLATFAEPRRENGSMMDDNEFAEFVNFYFNISRKITFLAANGTELTYQDICHPFCDINNMLIQALTTPSFLVDRAYPSFTILSFKVNIGKFIFKRSFHKQELTGSKLMAMYFTVFVDSDDTKQQLDQFDKKVFEFAEAFNKRPDRLINITLHGNYPVQLEVERGFAETVPLIFGGLLLGLFVFSATVILTARLFRQFGCNTGLWLLTHLFILIAVIPASLGSTCLLDLPINVLIPMTPVAGIILILNSLMTYHLTDMWHRITANLVKSPNVIMIEAAEFGKKQNPLTNGNSTTVIYRATKPERMAHLFEQVSRDVVTFFLVNTAGLFVTSYFSIPNYQMAFAFFGFVVLYLSLLQLFFFCPIMMLTCGCYRDNVMEHKPPSKHPEGIPCTRKIKKYFSQKVVAPYSKLLKMSVGKIVFISVFCIGFLWPASYGIRHLQNHMDLRKILPNDSPKLKAFEFMDQHVWNDFLQFIFVVNNPPDFEDPVQFGQFKEMLNELESLNQTYGPDSNMMWLSDYVPYELDQNWLKDRANMTTLDMSKFLSFISNEPYNKWNDGLKWTLMDPSTNQTRIDSMLMMITFKDVTSLQGKVDCLTASRAVIDKYPQFDVAVFDTDSATVDMILSVPPTMMSVMIVLTVLTAVISCLSMLNLVAATICTVFTASNIIGLFGFCHFLCINLDSLETGTFVFSSLIGHLVILQTVSVYLRETVEKQRLQLTLERMLCQSLKLLALSLALTVPVMMSPVQVHTDNIKILQIAVASAVVHCSFFVPATLNIFSKCIDNACLSE